MKIKQKLSLSLFILAFLIITLFGVNVFGFYKISVFYNSIGKLNSLSNLFYKESLLINKYSYYLTRDSFDNEEKNAKLTAIEIAFLNDYHKANSVIEYIKNNNFNDSDEYSLDKLGVNHRYFKKAFLKIKEIFINDKTSKEKKSLALSLINEKRSQIEKDLFSGKSQLASSTDSFYYTALYKYNKLNYLETNYLYIKSDKESLNILLSSINDFELFINTNHLFNKNANIFSLLGEYRDELDNYIRLSDNQVIGKNSTDFEINEFNDYLINLLTINTDNDIVLSGLKENLNKRINDYFVFIAVLDAFFGVFLFLFLFLIYREASKYVIKSILKISDFSSKIGSGVEHKSLQIDREDEIGDLAKALNEIDNRFVKTNNNLLKKIDELKNKDKIESLVEALTDGVIMYDQSKNIIFKNKVINSILNIPNNKLTLKNLFNIFIKHNLEFYINLSLRTDEVYRIDNIELFGKMFEIIITQVIGHDNKIIGGLMIFHKIERNKKNKYQKNNKLDLGSIISPHFRTPLLYIKLFTEILSSGKIGHLNKEQNECISNIHQSAINMKELINKLQDITILNNDDLEIKTEELEIATYLKDLIKKYTEQNKIKKVDFNFKDVLPGGIKTNIDKKLFSKVFNDIVDNSITYSNDENALVDIELKELGFNYLISIKDNGIGIPEEEQDYIFKKFFRAKNAIVKSRWGSGISLYVAKRILNKTGVELFFESKIGEGTTFFIEIPKGGMRK